MSTAIEAPAAPRLHRFGRLAIERAENINPEQVEAWRQDGSLHERARKLVEPMLGMCASLVCDSAVPADEALNQALETFRLL